MASSFLRTSSLLATSFPVKRNVCGGGSLPRIGLVLPVRSQRRWSGVLQASSSGTADENMVPDPAPGQGGYNCVDANMLVLRRRIEGLRVKESFIQTPEEWMEWEKSCYHTYRADVNVLVACLQSQLLGMRPSVVLSILSLVFAVTPVVCLLLLYAVGTQLYAINNIVLDFLFPCATSPPL